MIGAIFLVKKVLHTQKYRSHIAVIARHQSRRSESKTRRINNMHLKSIFLNETNLELSANHGLDVERLSHWNNTVLRPGLWYMPVPR